MLRMTKYSCNEQEHDQSSSEQINTKRMKKFYIKQKNEQIENRRSKICIQDLWQKKEFVST